MLKTNIKGRTIYFKNSFDELTVQQFANIVKKDKEVIKRLKQADQLAKDIDQLQKAGEEEEASFLETDLVGKMAEIQILKIELFSLLAKDPQGVEDYLLTTPGIAGQIKELIEIIDSRFDNWKEFFESVKPVKSFRFKDYRRHGIRRLKRANFFVADLDQQTLIRDAGALIVAQRIGSQRKEFEKNNWQNFARFAAYVCRPKKEEFEYMPKRRRRSFIGGAAFERMSATDRLSLYNQKLSEVVDQRTEIFQDLPLSTAIGIYKYYFFLKKKSTKHTKAFIKKTQRQQKKQSFTKKRSDQKQALKT